MRRRLIIVVAVAQVALLAFMAGQREWVSLTGRTVWLRTAPVDPLDPMRGAYVRLNYELSRVPRELCRDGVAVWMDAQKRNATGSNWRESQRQMASLRDRQLYAVLREGPHGIAELVALTDRRPASGVYLRGRVSWADAESVNVRYGIEALFLQQEKAKRLETDAWKRTREDGVRLDAEVAVSGSGLAVLKGSRWEPLGIASELEIGILAAPAGDAEPDATAQPVRIDLGKMPARRTRSGSEPSRAVVAVTVEMKNHGERPLAVWAPGDGRAFRLVTRKNWGESRCRWVGADIPPAKPDAAEIVILKPGESRKVRLDLAAPAWALRYSENATGEELATSIPGLVEQDVRNWSFRIEYAPPTAAECAGLPGAELLWQKAVQTRGFSPTSDRAD